MDKVSEADVYLPPLSSRVNDARMTKNEWLIKYYQFRKYHKDSRTLVKDAKHFQESLGKNSSDLANRFRGSLLGLAVGDALGTTLEFSSREPTDQHSEMIGEGPFHLKPGQWTDDTSMALCLAYSLYNKHRFSAQDQMDLYVQWWQQGLFSSTGSCFDIGNTVVSALKAYQSSGDPFSGSCEEQSAGNGALMRLSPIVLYYASDASEAIHWAGQSSRTTHQNVQSVDACRLMAAIILGALYGESKDNILRAMYSPIDSYWQYHPLCEQVKQIANGSYKTKNRSQIESTGYVIHSLEAALWAFFNSNSFESGMIKAVNLAGDSDTIGAIYGQIAGAYYGELGIPFKWIKSLSEFHYFYFFADEFVSYYSGKPINPSG